MFWIAALAAIFAIFDHVYLLNEHYGLRYGQASNKSLCDINEIFSCAAASASRYSEFLGVPMALWGIVANAIALVLIGWYFMSDDTKKTAARRNLLLVSSVIAVASVAMGFISTFLISRFCPFCMLAYVLSFIMLGALWSALRTRDRGSLSAFHLGDLMPVAILTAVGMVAGFVADDAMTKSYGARDLGPMVQDSVANWLASPALNITTQDPLVMGASAEQAKMKIVEFADFRCIHCKHASPVLKAFVSSHPDARLEFEVWPLDGECNTSIPHANGASCLLARAAYCAQKTVGRGWAAHEFIYDNQENFGSLDAVRKYLPEIAKASGMTSEQMSTCTDSPEAKESVQKQAALGSSLNLQGTPTIFVNGRALKNGQILQILSAAYAKIP